MPRKLPLVAALVATFMLGACGTSMPNMQAGPGASEDNLRLDSAACAVASPKVQSASQTATSMAGSALATTVMGVIVPYGQAVDIAANLGIFATQSAAGTPFIGAGNEVDEVKYTECMKKKGYVMAAGS